MTKITYCSNKSCSNFNKALPTSKVVCPICGHPTEELPANNSSETKISLDGNSANQEQNYKYKNESFIEDACPVCGTINCPVDPRPRFRDAKAPKISRRRSLSKNRRNLVRRAISIFLLLFIVALSYSNKEEFHGNVIHIPSSEIGRNLPQELRREIQKQMPGFLTIDIPLEMKAQEESLGKICITQTERLPCNRSLESNSKMENIRTSSLARVVLEGSKFDIYALNNEEQAITDLSTSQWSWHITPLQAGKHILTIRISLWLTSIHDNKEVYQDLELKSLNTNVRRNLNYDLKAFLATYGIRIILTSIILLALIASIKLFFKKKYLLTRTTHNLSTLINDFIQGIKKMANDPKSQTFHFGTVNGSVNAGGEVDTQNHYNQQQSHNLEFNQALVEIRQFLDSFTNQEKSFSDAEQIKAIDVEFEKINNEDDEKWNRWMACLSVAFAGGIETAKALNPWAGIPIEVLKKLYEVYQGNRKRHSLEQ